MLAVFIGTLLHETYETHPHAAHAWSPQVGIIYLGEHTTCRGMVNALLIWGMLG